MLRVIFHMIIFGVYSCAVTYGIINFDIPSKSIQRFKYLTEWNEVKRNIAHHKRYKAQSLINFFMNSCNLNISNEHNSYNQLFVPNLIRLKS